jgi:uncharacterized membrane protein YeaQ/YmgE (transglycosylase-associated protein family)
MFGVMGWILFGFILGLLARIIVPRTEDGPFLRVLIGIAGAVFGGVLAVATGMYEYGNLGSFLVAVGACLLALLLYRLSLPSEQHH